MRKIYLAVLPALLAASLAAHADTIQENLPSTVTPMTEPVDIQSALPPSTSSTQLLVP